jgi:hypothetical protein
MFFLGVFLIFVGSGALHSGHQLLVGGKPRCGLEPVDKMSGENYGFIVCMSMEEWRLGYVALWE